MKYCYLCHNLIEPQADGTIAYNESSSPTATLYGCKQCVEELGTEEAFNQLEEHYQHRASLKDTIPKITRDSIIKQN
jgi:hypothetical protein